jgi:hypothetical protein
MMVVVGTCKKAAVVGWDGWMDGWMDEHANPLKTLDGSH